MSPHKSEPETNTDDVVGVDALLAQAHAGFAAANPQSARLHAGAAAHMPGGNTRTVLYARPFPLTAASAGGKHITSVDGRRYVDFLGEYSAGLFGHSHPQIKAALAGVLENGWSLGAESLAEKELARKLTARFGASGLQLVRFTNSGTEANTMALAAALVWTGRRKIVVFSNAYHGATLMFPLAVCRWMHAGGGGAPPCTTVNLPHDFVVAPYNNVAETRAILDALAPASVAAIVVDAVQGSAGCRPALPAFVRFLRDAATRLGALLVVDEVMTSRLAPGGVLSTFDGVQADLLTLGKWVAGGMSFGAFGGRRDIMALFDPGRAGGKGPMHPGTFNNNAFSMAAGVAALDVFHPARVAALNRLGDRMKAGIAAALLETGVYPAAHAPALVNPIEIDSFAADTRLYVRPGETIPVPRVMLTGAGSMLNLRFHGADADKWHNVYYHFMLDHGIYLATRGYTPLTLEITADDVDEFVRLVREFLLLHREALRENDV